MALNADHSFHIGHQHLRGGVPCQDYALSGVHDDRAYAIVSDGCSTGRMTDVGARLVALACRVDILGGTARPGIGSDLGLDLRDMLATCVRAVAGPSGCVVDVAGDGAFALRMADGSIRATRLDWANNMPCYPAYRDDDHASFIAGQGGDLSAQALTWEEWSCEPGRPMARDAGGAISLGDGIAGFHRDIAIEGVTHVAVFTDGILQVEGMQWHEVVQALLAFKNTAGEFAKRRMQRFLADAGKLGRGPQDDIAYAVVDLTAR